MPRTNVNEVNVNSVDLGHEHGKRIQSRLHLAPVVVRTPVADDFLELAELIALRAIRDGLPVRPPRVGNAPTEIDKRGFGNVNLERANCGVAGR